MSEVDKSVGTIQIQFSKSIIDRLRAIRIPIDIMGTVYLVLLALFEEKYELLDVLDDDNKEKKAAVLYRQLVLRGLIELAPPEHESVYRLTPMGNELVTFFKEQVKDQLPKNIEVKAEQLVTIATTEKDDIALWISEYVDLFPIKNGENRQLRMHELTAEGKMCQFIKRYKYAKDTILAATALYIREQDMNDPGHKYTKNSNNFIQKYGTGIESELASWCKRYLETEHEPEGFDSRILDMA